MNRFKFPSLDYQQENYIKKRFWARGTVSGFLLKETVGSDDAPNGVMVFCDYAPTEYNVYDYPVKATLINKRGVKFIPSTIQEIDKDIVIGFIQRNEKSVQEFVDLLVDKLVECELSIYQNLQSIKTPLMISCSPEDEEAVRKVVDAIDESRSFVFIPSEYADRIKALNSGANYNIDKLYNYRQALENELREFLGLENLGFAEKKEHLLTSEIEQNDQVTETSGNTFFNCLKEFCERIENVFGYPMPIILTDTEDKKEEPAKENEEEEEVQDQYD